MSDDPSTSSERFAGAPDAVHVDAESAEPRSAPDVVLAVDVGATHFQAGLVTSRGMLIDRARAEIEVEAGPESQFTTLALIVTEMLDRADARHSATVRGLGVSSGGHVSRGLDQVSPLSVPAWRDFPLRDRLEELAGHEVHGDLDAKALALAEGWLGAAQGQSNFCVITVSAGISGGIILDGDLLDGESGYAGQIGHLIVEPGGRRCLCGVQGCLEAEASGQAIDAITGRPATEPTYQIMQRTGDLVGRAAASMCNAFDLSLVVIGGSVALGFGSTFFHAAQVTLDEHARQPYSRGARITPSRLGEQGPLVGAGAVGWRGLRRAARRRPAVEQPAVEQPAVEQPAVGQPQPPNAR